MKTGTPPRVDGRSLDYNVMIPQPGDVDPGKFSYSSITKPLTKQLDCHMTYTSPLVHDLLKEGFDLCIKLHGKNTMSPSFTSIVKPLFKSLGYINSV